MKTKKIICLLNVLLLSAFMITSCSSDDDENKGGFNINSENYTVDNAQCSKADWISFSVQFWRGQDSYEFSFRVYGIANVESLKVNDDITEDIIIRNFRETSDFNAGDYEEDFEGKITVKSISNNTIELDFSNFKFKKILSNSTTKSYAMNGTINFNRI